MLLHVSTYHKMLFQFSVIFLCQVCAYLTCVTCSRIDQLHILHVRYI